MISDTYVGYRDKNGNLACYHEMQMATDKTISNNVVVARKINNTLHYNFIDVKITPTGNKTYSVGDATNFRSAIGAAAASSDRRLKSNIKLLNQDAVKFISKLEPCVYTINGERQVGLIAQDVHDADTWGTRMAFETVEGIDGLDDWEKMPDGSPTWKLDYIRIIPPLVTTVQEQNKKIKELESRIEFLESKTN